MTEPKYCSASQQRVLRTLLVLANHPVEGVLPGVIAAHLQTLPSNTTRDLANLRIVGLARKDKGLWFPTLKVWQSIAAGGGAVCRQQPTKKKARR